MGPVTFTTSDNFDFTGGDGGQGQDVNGLRLVQTDPNFGTAIGIAIPPRPPRVIQLSVRLNF